MWGHSENLAFFKPGSKFSPGSEGLAPWSWDFPASRTVTHKFVLFKPPNLWCRQFPAYESSINFLASWWYKSNTHLVETVLEFWTLVFSWASDMQSDTVVMLGSEPRCAVSCTVRRVNNPHADKPLCTHGTFLVFTFAGFNKLHDIFNTLL